MKKGLLSLVLVLSFIWGSSQVLFNQVYISNRNHQQFIELYNPSADAEGVDLDCYSMVTFYRTNQDQGFYVLDFPGWHLAPQSVITASSGNIKGNRGSIFSWNNLPEGATLKKYLLQNGRFGYQESAVPSGFEELIQPGRGINDFVVMLFDGQRMIDAFLGDRSNALPDLIAQMPDLKFTSSCGSPVQIRFSELNQLYAPIFSQAGRSFAGENGAYRRLNGRCGEWYGSLRLSQDGAVYNSGYALKTSYDRSHATVSYEVQRTNTAPAGYYMKLYIDKQPYGVFGSNDVELSVQSTNAPRVSQLGSFTNVSENYLIMVLDAPGDCYDIVRPVTPEDPVRPLPVNFTWFDVRKNNAQVQVAWQTSQQQDIRGYEIQSRYGEDAWRTIAYVIPETFLDQEDRTLEKYMYGDNRFSADPDLQYRVKVVSRDGSYGYSEVKSVPSLVQNRPLRVYPNPTVDGRVFISFNENNVLRDVQLIDMSGRLVNQWRSVNTSSHQMDHLRRGNYIVRILNRETGSVYSEKIMVQ